MINKIMEYLGIEEENMIYIENQKAIEEAEIIEEKYKNELATEKYGYGFHNDIFRFYDKDKENIIIIEKLEYITVYEIKEF